MKLLYTTSKAHIKLKKKKGEIFISMFVRFSDQVKYFNSKEDNKLWPFTPDHPYRNWKFWIRKNKRIA